MGSVTKHIKDGADVNYRYSEGWSVLVIAAESGHTDIVRLLLNHGANIEHKTKDGDTALTWAADWGHTDTVRLLLSVGADKFVKNNKGQTPEDVARNRDTKSVFNEYNETGDDKVNKLLVRAIKENNFSAALILVVRGVNIEIEKFDVKTQQQF